MVASDQTKLLRALICQSVLKYTLTEGDKLVVGWTSPLEDQGAYAIAINYGKSG
jgi:oligosaccharide translocation protein RFT1